MFFLPRFFHRAFSYPALLIGRFAFCRGMLNLFPFHNNLDGWTIQYTPEYLDTYKVSHAISIGSIEEHIFLLNQLATSSLTYVGELRNSFAFHKEEEWQVSEFDYEFMRYQGQLESVVSDYLIQSATRTSIFQDSWKVGGIGYDSNEDAYQRFENVARCTEGEVGLSVREVCNKIIHAIKFELECVCAEQQRLKYWSGKCHLHGVQRGKCWHVELNVKQWGFVLQYYYDTVDIATSE
ncbi:hypothetical protein [Pseudomonas sp. BP8]|uniref:hypothetical protein n=1 Tax=Pseudomonas sp. BP8 TaxID=2817864 RepID=UPI001AE90849|nr:hypothetical protein [Pseudomonas sp. BP8]MBP2261120.1 hypothetical protein [Pseudomonas sp. BP8]HDS1734902.1 hypothetical protein [Pseudomonas putida]